jgi:hypothetical protein
MEQNYELFIEMLSDADLSRFTFCVDFDGTCVTHDFPEVGSDVPHAVQVLKALANSGAKLIVWTIRCDSPKSKNGDCDNSFYLSAAKEWFAKHNIPLYSANLNPTQAEWSTSPKAYCDFYIDDAAIGTPLIYGQHSRAFVDWQALLPIIVERIANRL